LAEAVATLCDANPLLEIQLTAAPRVMKLADREVDIAFSVSRPTSGRLKARKITDYQLYLYASEEFIEERGPISRIDDLKRLRGIGYIPDQIYDEQLNYLPTIRADLRPHLMSSSINVQLRLTLQGKGVCILPKFIACQHPTLVRLLPADIDITRSFWLITHEDMGRLEKVRACANFLADQVRTKVAALA
jgi:DNA-binding transcriptional LysR family regulator